MSTGSGHTSGQSEQPVRRSVDFVSDDRRSGGDGSGGGPSSADHDLRLSGSLARDLALPAIAAMSEGLEAARRQPRWWMAGSLTATLAATTGMACANAPLAAYSVPLLALTLAAVTASARPQPDERCRRDQ